MHSELPEIVGQRFEAGRWVTVFADGRRLPVVRGGDASATLEKEINEGRAELRKLQAEESTERQAAEELVARLRSDGADLLDAKVFDQIDEAFKPADQKAQDIAELRKRIDRAVEIDGGQQRHRQDRPSDNRPENRRRDSPGFRFANHETMAHLRTSGILAHGKARVETEPVEVLDRGAVVDMLRRRTTIDISQSGGLVPIDQALVTQPVDIPVRGPAIWDYITLAETDSSTIKWSLQTTRSDAAAPTPFGTSAPEAAYAWALQTTNVKRIPEFVPVTKDQLADIPQLTAEVESLLQYGVKIATENQMLNGDNIGENFKGILNTAGILTEAKGADTGLDAIHKAITKIRLGIFGEPTAVGINPLDYENNVALAKDSIGNYLFKMGEPETVWGKPAILSPFFTQGTSIVANWRWAWLWVREGISVSASDGVNDFFLKGMVAVLAELRAAFAVRQPKAFCTVTGL